VREGGREGGREGRLREYGEFLELSALAGREMYDQDKLPAGRDCHG
jgi:hypothetical protein